YRRAKKSGLKRKIPPPDTIRRWDSRIARFMIRYLELQPPGARRHTHTAETTETIPHGLLDFKIHNPNFLQEESPNVNAFAQNLLDAKKCPRRWRQIRGGWPSL